MKRIEIVVVVAAAAALDWFTYHLKQCPNKHLSIHIAKVMAKVSFLNGEYVITVEKWPYILIIFGITVVFIIVSVSELNVQTTSGWLAHR